MILERKISSTIIDTVCTNQGTVKRLGSTAKGKNAKYTGVLSLTHTRELAVAPIGYPVAGTREFY